MSFIYGYTKNKTVIFGILLVVFFNGMYFGTFFPQVTVTGVVVIIAGCSLLMIIFNEIIGMTKESNHDRRY